MAQLLPPSPNGSPPGSAFWNDWYEKLRKLVNDASNFKFTALNFVGSNLTSITTRNHNDLQNLQGGNTNDRQHLTTSQLNVFTIQSKAGPPTTTEITSGTWALYKDTSVNTIRLWANDGGTLKSILLT